MKKVLVLLEVTVDDDVPEREVRKHIAREAQAARGQYTGITYDWRAYISVKSKPLGWIE